MTAATTSGSPAIASAASPEAKRVWTPNSSVFEVGGSRNGVVLFSVNVENWLTASPLGVVRWTPSSLSTTSPPDRRCDQDDIAVETELYRNRLCRIVVQANRGEVERGPLAVDETVGTSPDERVWRR